jgi:hypothetical protein
VTSKPNSTYSGKTVSLRLSRPIELSKIFGPSRPLFRGCRRCYRFGCAATPEGPMGAVEHARP